MRKIMEVKRKAYLEGGEIELRFFVRLEGEDKFRDLVASISFSPCLLLPSSVVCAMTGGVLKESFPVVDGEDLKLWSGRVNQGHDAVCIPSAHGREGVKKVTALVISKILEAEKQVSKKAGRLGLEGWLWKTAVATAPDWKLRPGE